MAPILTRTALAIALLASFPAQCGESTTTVDAVAVKALVEKLGAEEFNVRNAAKQGLLKLGDAVWRLIEPYSNDADAERGKCVREIRHELVRTVVERRLDEICPPKEKDYVYEIEIAEKWDPTPEAFQLDFVYKIGHYHSSLIALRFERDKGEKQVRVTRFCSSSAFHFIKDADQSRDQYSTHRGVISIAEFELLWERAFMLYNSKVKRRYVGPPLNGGSSSMMTSSGDGRIVFNLKVDGVLTNRKSGTLVSGGLSSRIKGDNFNTVRLHLLWEQFHNSIAAHEPEIEIPPAEAAKLAIDRLTEEHMIDEYHDSYRLELYARILGELGRPEALPALEKLARSPGLPDSNWDKFVTQDAEEAIAKIKILSSADPGAGMLTAASGADERIARWATERLCAYPAEKRTPLLRQVVEKSIAFPVRLPGLIPLLADDRSEEAREIFRRCLKTDNTGVRLCAAKVLWKNWRDESVVPPLMDMFEGRHLPNTEYPASAEGQALEILLDPAQPAVAIEKVVPRMKQSLAEYDEKKHSGCFPRGTVEAVISFELRDLLPPMEAIVQARPDSWTLQSDMLEAQIVLAPENATARTHGLTVKGNPRLQQIRRFFIAALKLEDMKAELEAEHAAEEIKPPEESRPRRKEIQAVLKALATKTAGEHAAALLECFDAMYSTERARYGALLHLLRTNPDSAEVKDAVGKYLTDEKNKDLRVKLARKFEFLKK